MFAPFIRAFAAAAVALTLATPLLATVAKPAPGRKSTAEIRAPGNGNVTRTQLQAEVRQAFNRADTNHDGYMSRAEFAVRMGVIINNAPARLGTAPTKEQAQRMLDAANAAFNDVDTNHDGKLSLSEATYRPLKAFDAMDANHDGVLTPAEKLAFHQGLAGAPQPAGPTLDDQGNPGH
jgi:hypothetical protein